MEGVSAGWRPISVAAHTQGRAVVHTSYGCGNYIQLLARIVFTYCGSDLFLPFFLFAWFSQTLFFCEEFVILWSQDLSMIGLCLINKQDIDNCIREVTNIGFNYCFSPTLCVRYLPSAVEASTAVW